MPWYRTSRGTEYWAAGTPGEESRLQRAVRLHFWITVAALLAWEGLVLAVLRLSPETLPMRWHLYMEPVFSAPPDHHYLYGRAFFLLLFEGAAAWFFYRPGGFEAKLVAGLMGFGVLVGIVTVDLVLLSVRVPAYVADVAVLAWISAGHLAYAFLGKR